MKTTTALFATAFVVLVSSFASAEPSSKKVASKAKTAKVEVVQPAPVQRTKTLLEQFADALKDSESSSNAKNTSSATTETTETGVISTPQDAPDGQKVSLVISTSKAGKPSGYATTATKMPIGRTHKSGRVLAQR